MGSNLSLRGGGWGLQALNIRFHKQRQNKVCTNTVDFNNLESKCFIHLESLICSHIASIFTFSVDIFHI